MVMVAYTRSAEHSQLIPAAVAIVAWRRVPGKTLKLQQIQLRRKP